MGTMGSSGERSGDMSGERPGGHSGEDQWLTYDEIGRIRGIGRESAVKLVQRKRWRREAGNDGTARVLVPGDWQGKARAKAPRPSSGNHSPRRPPGQPPPGHSPELSRVTSAFAAAVASLTDRAEAAERRANQAEAKAEAAVAPIEQLRRVLREAEAGLTAERAARAEAEAERALAEAEATRLLTDLRDATEEAETEALAAQQDRVETEAVIKAAETEAAKLRQALDQARQTADAETAALREAVEQATQATRAAEAARDADRPTMVASKIDEVQFRRLQEAELARKTLGRLARLRVAWRGE
jgi:hypothetical protein